MFNMNFLIQSQESLLTIVRNCATLRSFPRVTSVVTSLVENATPSGASMQNVRSEELVQLVRLSIDEERLFSLFQQMFSNGAQSMDLDVRGRVEEAASNESEEHEEEASADILSKKYFVKLECFGSEEIGISPLDCDIERVINECLGLIVIGAVHCKGEKCWYEYFCDHV